MEQTALALAGLGLFLSGLNLLSGSMQAIAGRRTRALLSRLTQGQTTAALAGTVLGALTQSTGASAFVCIGLLNSGALTLAGAMTLSAWSSVGTSLLVFLAAIDVRLIGLHAVGLVGIAYLMGFHRNTSARHLVGILFATGVLLVGIGLVKDGGANLRNSPWVIEFFEFSGETPVIALLVGVIVTLIAQSAATVSVLVVTLNLAGALPLSEALLLVAGASVGSGMSISLVTSHLRGPPRLLAVWQCLVRMFGTAMLLPLVFALPADAAARAAAFGIGIPSFIAFFYLALQVVGALVSGLLQRSLLPMLTRFIPEEEVQARFAPRHIYAEAARCPDTALLLAHREQDRLLRELPSALDPLRAAEVAGREILSNRERREAANALCRQIADYLADVAAQEDAALPVATLFAARARNEAISALQESLHALVDTLEGLPPEGLAASMTESLHLVLELLTESLVDGVDNADILETLTSDRSELMEGIRRSLLSEAGEASPQQQALFVATSLFERALWLGRQMLGANQLREA